MKFQLKTVGKSVSIVLLAATATQAQESGKGTEITPENGLFAVQPSIFARSPEITVYRCWPPTKSCDPDGEDEGQEKT